MSAAAFRLVLRTPERTVFDADVDAAVIPGVRGTYGILAGHAPMLGAVATGILRAEQNGRTLWFVTGGGVAEVATGRVEVLVDAVFAVPDAADAEQKLEVFAREEHLAPVAAAVD